ncbi:uncharacterized protein LOC101854828 [Aplysia californica]|uniref:L-dopachrome isomerase n=1 Tax=Aplysia californica TaxID=6500 RepID=A0ABM0K5P4_APLCA|nr:uncharacterized protein LOC101854828 [Aplysia californica]
MPLVTIQTNAKSVPKDYQSRVFEFFKELFITPNLGITIETGKDMTFGGSSDPTVTISILAVARFHPDTNPRLHKAIAEFFSTTLNIPVEKTVVVLQRTAPVNVSFNAKPLPDFLARDRDIEFWQG